MNCTLKKYLIAEGSSALTDESEYTSGY